MSAEIDAGRLAERPLRFTTIETITMDPRLQRLLAQRRSGRRFRATASTGVDEIAVIAEVSDVEAWQALTEVRPGATIPDGDGGAIVTGRVRVSDVESLRGRSFVRTLKAARPLFGSLAETTRDIRASSLSDLKHRGGWSGIPTGIASV